MSKIPARVEKELKLIAVDKAIDALEDDDMEEETKKTDKKLETCTCPECGYEGSESKFKK